MIFAFVGRGKRVVFLRHLKSGLLLVTGPYKINGVPLRRVNRAYVMPTMTKVNLQGINLEKLDKIEESMFIRPKLKKKKKSEEAFFSGGLEVPYFILNLPFLLIFTNELHMHEFI